MEVIQLSPECDVSQPVVSFKRSALVNFIIISFGSEVWHEPQELLLILDSEERGKNDMCVSVCVHGHICVCAYINIHFYMYVYM